MYKELFHQHELYPVKIKFIECDSLPELKKRVPELVEWADTRGYLYATTINGRIKIKGIDWKCIYVVINQTKTLPKINSSVVAHELVHVKNFIFEIIGHENTLENDEPEAYLIQQLMAIACKFYRL